MGSKSMKGVARILTLAVALQAGVAAAAPRYEATGIASWYGDQFHGRKTASGELYDRDRITVAHPSLPLGSMVEITNLSNKRSIWARVNDRGPFSSKRILDVSRAAADQLGFREKGLAQVRIRYEGGSGATRSAPPEVEFIKGSAPSTEKKLEKAGDEAASGFTIQAGLFAKPGNAERAAAALASIGEVKILEQSVRGAVLRRVVVGAFASRSDAEALLAEVATAGFADARVVKAS